VGLPQAEVAVGWRFKKRISVLGLFHINLSKTGVSLSIGVPGATANINKDGVDRTLGLPGSGISHKARLMERDKDD